MEQPQREHHLPLGGRTILSFSCSSDKLDFPATSRNREAIAEVLSGFGDASAPLRLLEVASGSGQHVTFFADRFPQWTFQPSDVEPAHLRSIDAYRADSQHGNLLPPALLDVSARPWQLTAGGPESASEYDVILAINLIHISPWSCTEALFAEGHSVLAPGGAIYLYGAFLRGGRHTADSNAAFDFGLRSQDPEWGVRCLDEVAACAAAAGFALESVLEMPANNLSVLFRAV